MLSNRVLSVLSHPGSLCFPSNAPYRDGFDQAGGRVRQEPTGHVVWYRADGRRLFATDPDGHPLHECEWGVDEQGRPVLARARFRLDWGQWVGLEPSGLVNATTLNLAARPGWQRIRPDDLRGMASQALGVPLEEVRFFYQDSDLAIDAKGLATIRHRKDAFYVLDDGTFNRARFMACMGAMHWDRIDFLPVVELFQSLLPGTGSAALELIRALYDDQNRGEPQPLPLRYRGIPTYPSEAAFRLFGAFFAPTAPGGQAPFPIFMDVPRSHEVLWLPKPDPPRRHFDPSHDLCVTIANQTVLKATIATDSTGLSYGRVPANGRVLEIGDRTLILRDGQQRIDIPLPESFGPVRETGEEERTRIERYLANAAGWRNLFVPGPPTVAVGEAFSAVLLYPDDDREIDEPASQPFVADHLEDLRSDSTVAPHLAGAKTCLIVNFDAAVAACLDLNRSREYLVLYTRAAYAQKQAQALWTRLEQGNLTGQAHRIKFAVMGADILDTGSVRHDLVYDWIPFGLHEDENRLNAAVAWAAGAMQAGGLCFMVGPPAVRSLLKNHRLHLVKADPVEQLPTFRMHRTILPRAKLRGGLTLYYARKI